MAPRDMAECEDEQALARFIRRHIHSAEELEALLLLFRAPRRWWTAEQAGRALHLDAAAARRALERLSGAFLEVKIETELLYRFATLNVERERLAACLDRAYRQNRTALMRLVSGHGAARDFADAFRIKDEDP